MCDKGSETCGKKETRKIEGQEDARLGEEISVVIAFLRSQYEKESISESS